MSNKLNKFPFYVMSETSLLERSLNVLNTSIDKLRAEVNLGVFPKHAPRGSPTIGTSRRYLKSWSVERARIIRELGLRVRKERL